MPPIDTIKKVASKTDRAILFHSAAGKDSIALLDMMKPHFRELMCVYMYVVPNLEHINKFISFAENKYNVSFLQVPHYCISSMIKTGYMGIVQKSNQKNLTLAHITESVRMKTGIEWAFFGFKQSDSLNRRLMLRTYEDNAICGKSKKCYPLSEWKNGDVLAYIRHNRLINPINYGGIGQSSGTAIDDIHFLLWCKNNYPADYCKVIDMFPLADIKVFEHEQANKRAIRKTA